MDISSLYRPHPRLAVRPHSSGRSRLPDLPCCVVLALLVLLLSPAARAQLPPASEAPSEYTVILDAPSVGERLRAANAPSRTGLAPRSATSAGVMRRAVTRAQDPIIAVIKERGIEVLGRVSNVLNAVFVRATAAQAGAIGELPGVRGVVPGQRYAPMLESVSKIVRVSAARIRPSGHRLFGEGFKIAIIDSGLDFEHEAFRDDSLPALKGYPKGDERYLHLANSKVIAVRSYVQSLVSSNPATSTPDELSPDDLSGHGTAVAMIAAGKPVSTPLGVVSGMAPKARLGVYKVFGSPELNYYTADHVVLRAIDDAVADGMDILNLSLGNPEFHPWDAMGPDCGISYRTAPCNAISMAAHSAVHDFGKVVVAAAGNFGYLGSHSVPAKSTLLSPGHTPAVITVGGTGNSISLKESVRVGGQSFVASSGTGPGVDGPLSAPALLASDLENSQGCDAYPAAALAGRVVVVDRGNCFFVDKVEHADAAGAAGVLVINHQGDELVSMALLDATDIPAFFVGGTDGAAIRALLADSANLLTLDPSPVASVVEWAYVAHNSSRGPSLSLDLKPDLVAPGFSVYTAAPHYNDEGNLHDPSGFREVSGTSFATPVVSGAAALVWQAFPSLSARQVASALINSASATVLQDELPAPVTAAGAGVLDIGAALRPTATVVPPSIAFGSIGDVEFPIRREIVIANKASKTQLFRLSVEPREADTNARVTVNGSRVAVFTLPVGASVSVQVGLTGARPLPGSYEGRLKLLSLIGTGELSIPYLYVVGDNEPANALQFRGRAEVGIEGEEATKTVAARVIDRFGVPVKGYPVQFNTMAGAATIVQAQPRSGPTGLIYATVRYGSVPGPQVVVATIGGLQIPFSYEGAGVRPKISTIANSASLAEGIVAGSLATIRGTDFALYPSGTPPTPQVRTLPLVRKDVTVAFDAVGRDVTAAGRIQSITEDSVTIQVPWELAGVASATVKVKAGNHSIPFQFGLLQAAPGIFSYESEGGVFGVALHPDGSPVTAGNPAVSGGLVTIAMTGNGQVESPPPSGAVGSLLNATVHVPTVWIGGEPSRVAYSGLDPGMAGLYLVTVEVPTTVPPGRQSLRMEINGAESNEVLLPIQ